MAKSVGFAKSAFRCRASRAYFGHEIAWTLKYWARRYLVAKGQYAWKR